MCLSKLLISHYKKYHECGGRRHLVPCVCFLFSFSFPFLSLKNATSFHTCFQSLSEMLAALPALPALARAFTHGGAYGFLQAMWVRWSHGSWAVMEPMPLPLPRPRPLAHLADTPCLALYPCLPQTPPSPSLVDWQ